MGMFSNLPDLPEEPKSKGYQGMFADLPDLPKAEPVVKKAGFFEAAIRDPLQKIAFSPMGLAETGAIATASMRIRENNYEAAAKRVSDVERATSGGFFPGYGKTKTRTAESLKAADTKLLNDHFNKLAKREKQGYTLMGRVGQITSNMPAYALEFLATGGLKTLGSAGAKWIGTKILKESAKKGLGKVAVNVAKFSAGAGTRAFAGMPHRAAESILKRTLPKGVTIDDLGDPKLIESDENTWTSIWKGSLDHYIEIASEQAGEFMGPAIHGAIGKMPLLGKAVGAMQRAWLKKFPTKSATDFIKKIGTKAGFNGVLGEIGEEDLGWMARALFDVEDYGAGKDASIGERLKAGLVQDIDNLPAELIAFSIPGLAGKGVSYLMPEGTPPIEPTPEKVKEQPGQYQVIEFAIGGKEIGPVQEEFKDEAEAKAYAETMTESSFTPGMFEVRPTEKPGDTFAEQLKDLEKLAEEKGLRPEIAPAEREFKEPDVTHFLTPQVHQAEIMGVKFMTKPAEIGKQRLDIEFNRHVRDLDKIERMINKLGGETTRSKAAAKLKNVPTKSIARFRELLNTNETAPAELSNEEKDIFNYFRNLSSELFKRENEVRAKIGRELIPYRTNYVRHIASKIAQEIDDGRFPIPNDLKFWMEERVKSKISNPMEFERELEDKLTYSRDIIWLSKAMMWTGLKEIHLSEPLKFFESQLSLHSEVIPSATRRWTESFINNTIKGQETDLDKSLNSLVKNSGLRGVFNKVLKPFGRIVSNRPLTNMGQKIGRLQIYGVMGGLRPKQLIRNKFQLLQNLALYTAKANLKAFLPASKQLKELMSESLFLETYKGFEDLTTIDKSIIGKLMLAPFQWTAVSNARQAFKVAYWDTLDLIENKKYKDLGWADPKRTYKEESGFLYQSEKEKLLREMEFGAGVTQYHYIPMAMPEVFKHKALTPLTRLQSWWMNYFFKFQREAGTRFLKGETGYGQQLPWSRRIGWARYMVIGGVILNTLGYTSSYVFGAAPDAFPPMGTLLINLLRWLKATQTGDDRSRDASERKMFNAIKTFVPGYLTYKDWSAILSGEKPLKSLFFYNKGIFAEKEQTSGRRRAKRKRPSRRSRRSR